MTITFGFSGGYLITHQARICGKGKIAGYVYADELPGFSYRRTVGVSLDDERLLQMECDFDCRVEVTIPISTSLGSHRLRVGAYGFRQDFGLEIGVQATPSATTSTPPPLASRTPPSAETATDGQSEEWIKVVGTYVTFDCPGSWQPTRTAGPDPLAEGWALEIPQAKHASLSFGGAGLDRLRPADVLLLSETAITLGGKDGFKWIRLTQTGGSDVAYEYYTTGHNNQGIFGISVVLAQRDPVIERQLDRLVQTIVFTGEPTPAPR